MELINFHSHCHLGQHQPPTYNRGSTPIDLCAGSIEFANALEAAWYLPFGEPIGLKGDHCTLGLDFDTSKLFQQSVSPILQLQQRGVNSNNSKLTQNFCKEAIKACQNANIFHRIHLLTACDQLTAREKQDIESLDSELTEILINADKKFIKKGNHPWSPELHMAYLVHYYWSLKLSHKCTGREYPQAFLRIEQIVPHATLRPPYLTTISENLRAAQSALQAIQKIAIEKRKTHLEELISAAAICKDIK